MIPTPVSVLVSVEEKTNPVLVIELIALISARKI